jgi:glucose-6-phosphate dehydrogenase assembly protein OpcA
VNRDLHDTKSSAILTALTEVRRRSGSAALGMVLTLVIDVDESDHYDALQAASSAAREHPCRIVTVIRRPGKSAARLDAEVRVGDENALGEVIVLRLYGPLREHADSVVLPMLLPDAPVLVWWPGLGPARPSEDQLGLLGQRRVTDAAAGSKPTAALKTRVSGHVPGDTDFTWTRITPWRTLLAAALDQPFDQIIGGEVAAARNNASAELLATWLETMLEVPFARKVSRGPGITGVRLTTKFGELAITRPDGRLATLTRTGQPDRAVPLPRRSTEELLAEELRRLDPDDIYNETIKHVFGEQPAPGRAARPASKGGQQLTRRPAPARKSAAVQRAEVTDSPSARRTHPTTSPAAAKAPARAKGSTPARRAAAAKKPAATKRPAATKTPAATKKSSATRTSAPAKKAPGRSGR